MLIFGNLQSYWTIVFTGWDFPSAKNDTLAVKRVVTLDVSTETLTLQEKEVYYHFVYVQNDNFEILKKLQRYTNPKKPKNSEHEDFRGISTRSECNFFERSKLFCIFPTRFEWSFSRLLRNK